MVFMGVAGEYGATAKWGYGMLVAGMLNLVGEYHSDSDARRDEERAFCLAKVKDPNYWVEHLFPDVYDRGLKNLPDVSGADLVEYRAAHGVALAIKKFERLGEEAVTVSTLSVNSADGPLAAFHDKVREVVEFASTVSKRARLDADNEVNVAARAVYRALIDACRAYTAAGNAPTKDRLTAVRNLANGRIGVRDRLPALAKAVGADVADDRDAAELATCMRRRRSGFMGVAAEHSGLIGVWKVGNGHVEDLRNGTPKVALSRVHLVTAEDFETEFDAWRT
ncbi:hypothetical protein [Actinomadura rifamycini]|uniref:hypothetical protein n=1 Tax=Actinomadura rifamycini TaxID=31962 RepID=UPI0012F94197|nr:hypothetical protein [Actinomadura rifamycini]